MATFPPRVLLMIGTGILSVGVTVLFLGRFKDAVSSSGGVHVVGEPKRVYATLPTNL